jgi:murein DD-endopeptidase MepM/ murein hydrolase activator NlpD
LFLVGPIVLLTVWLTWQQGWWPNQALADLRQEIIEQTSLSLPVSQPSAPSPPTVPIIVVNSKVIEHPQSQAYTADLYLPKAANGVIPWPNVAGRTKVLTYTVQEGDTLWSIAAQFELDLDTLRGSNPTLESNPDLLAVGVELVILPVPGAYHRASADETIKSIAAQYHVTEAEITAYPPNALYPPFNLKAGQGLIIPFGRTSEPAKATDTVLSWPVGGTLLGGFDSAHPAFDIGAPDGSAVSAARGGTISYAGWAEDGLSYTVVITHGYGLETHYSQLNETLVQPGQWVARGDPVGEVGSAGHASGPQVHFEVRLNGQPVDPAAYLPPGELP